MQRVHSYKRSIRNLSVDQAAQLPRRRFRSCIGVNVYFYLHPLQYFFTIRVNASP